MKNSQMVKSTINISATNFEALKVMVNNQFVGSMTEGINKGIEMIIKEYERSQYALGMEEAIKDPKFIDRTMQCQKEFDSISSEVEGEW